ncbi:hypothetical protein HG531_002917 [Fusarium graminearum]|nr:hypothetical protein HG531_002917 [Fusarium graminearum]
MDHAEMTDESRKVKLFRHDCETGLFQRITEIFVGLAENVVGELLAEFLGRKGNTRVPSEVVSHGSTNVDAEELVESFFEDLSVQETTKQNLLVLDSIRVVNSALSGDKGVQLSNHEENELVLLVILLFGDINIAKVNQNNLAQELSADLVVGHGVWDSENDSELLTQKCPCIRLAVEVVGLVRA